jgi:hypothetical protein
LSTSCAARLCAGSAYSAGWFEPFQTTVTRSAPRSSTTTFTRAGHGHWKRFTFDASSALISCSVGGTCEPPQ